MTHHETNTCPSCGLSRRERIDSPGSRCNDRFHTKDRVRRGRIGEHPFRVFDPFENRGTTRGECDLTDQEPEERAFGGAGRVVAPAGIDVPQDERPTASCDEAACSVCHPKPRRRVKSRQA